MSGTIAGSRHRRVSSASVRAGGAAEGERPVARQVVVRAYLPGHEDCHSFRAPWAERQPFKWNWYNWAWIGDMNARFQVRGVFSRARSRA